MTWITDDNGRRWVEMQPRKKRKPARALRFDGIKVGDQLVLGPNGDWYRKIPQHFLVTDLWFDPVKGQDDPTAGRMVAIVQINGNGEPGSRKREHTVRGLASQQYRYAEIDFMAQRRAAVAEVKSGKVVGIGHGLVIRKRPKMSYDLPKGPDHEK